MIRLRVRKRTNAAARIVKRIADRKAELLNKFGDDVALIAGNSMQRVGADSPRTSQPGEPPFIRSPEPNISTIRHVVVGDRVSVSPIKKSGGDTVNRSVPGVLEQGGYVVKRRRTRSNRQVTYTYRIDRRPFMGPAAKVAFSILRDDINKNGLTR